MAKTPESSYSALQEPAYEEDDRWCWRPEGDEDTIIIPAAAKPLKDFEVAFGMTATEESVVSPVL